MARKKERQRALHSLINGLYTLLLVVHAMGTALQSIVVSHRQVYLWIYTDSFETQHEMNNTATVNA